MATFRYRSGESPLDGYTIEYALGKGGFGEVYFARSERGREVALKAILDHEDTELRGVQNCMNVKSTRLLTVHDVQRSSDGTVWIVMEHIRGPSLHDIMGEAPNGLEREQAIFLLRELALGLADLHDAGIVHRDLKPSNAFFDGGRVKIGDYSLSKSMAFHEQSRHTMTVGSVHYMAPEIGLGRYDKTVDIYALGIIFFEMLTGRPPHTGESVAEILVKHLHSDVDVAPIASSLQEVIQKATNRDPTLRYQTPEEFAKSAMRLAAASPLADSFSPASLSLIGQRAQQKRRQATALEEKSRSSPLKRIESFDGGKEVGSRATRRAGEWIGTGANLAKPPTRSLELRLLHAALLVSLATVLQMFFSNRGGLGPFDGATFAMGIFGAAMIPAYRLFRWRPRTAPSGNSWPELAMRLVTAFMVAVFLFIYSTLATSLEIEGVVITCLGCALALSIIDWRNHVRSDRSATIQWYPTLASGILVATLCVLIRMPEWWLFAGMAAIGLTSAIQAVAPRSLLSPEHRRPSEPLPCAPN